MRSRIMRATILVGTLLAAAGCATSEEWADWKGHNTHFASGQHGFFSMRNTEGSQPRVTRADVDAARSENWWGKAITVRPEQIFQN